MATENTTDKMVEGEQSGTIPPRSHCDQVQPSMIHTTLLEASKQLQDGDPADTPPDSEPNTLCATSMTENRFNSGVCFQHPCVNLAAAIEETDLGGSPVTETNPSEPKTGTTVASYGTGASSPTSPSQDQTTFRIQRSVSFKNGEEKPSIDHTQGAQALQGYSLLNLVLTGKFQDVDEFNFMEASQPHEDQITLGRNHEATFMWADRVAASCLTASSPEFCPQPQKDAERGEFSEHHLVKRPFAKAVSAPAYNPLAVEWCPSSDHKDLDSFDECQNYADRSQTMASFEAFPSSGASGQSQDIPTSEWGAAFHHPRLPTVGHGSTMAAQDKKPVSSVKISTAVSDGSNQSEEKRYTNRSYNASHGTVPQHKMQSHDRSTLARRRAERQSAHAQMRPSRAFDNTTKLPPPPLFITRGYNKTNKATPSRPSPTPELQQGKPHVVTHAHSMSWKGLPSADLDRPSVDPEIANWAKVEQDLLRMGLIKRVPGKSDGGSFVVPKTFEQWLEFRAGRTEDMLRQSAAKLHRETLEVEVRALTRRIVTMISPQSISLNKTRQYRNIMIRPAMGGKEYHDGRCAVLAYPSTWSPWYKPTKERPEALWPCAEEMREEGDERHTSAFGRFLALPRMPGNPTVVWKVKPVIPALPFDEVWKLPNKDTWADLHDQKTDAFDEGYMKAMIGQTLLDAISC